MSPSWAGWPFSLQLEIENWLKNEPKFDFPLKTYFWLIFIITLFSKRIIYAAKSYCLKTTESHVNCKRTACTSFYSVSQSLCNLLWDTIRTVCILHMIWRWKLLYTWLVSSYYLLLLGPGVSHSCFHTWNMAVKGWVEIITN